MNSKVKVDSIFNNLQFLVSVITGFITAPIIINKLGKEDYGIWVFIMSLLSYSSVLYLGFGQSVVKYISQYTAKKDYESANQVLGTVFTFYSVVGGVVFLIAIIISFFLSYMIRIPSGHIAEYQIVMIILSLQVAFLFPASVFGGILMGTQRYVFTSISNIVAQSVNFCVILFTPKEYFTLLFLALVFMLINTISNLAFFVVVKFTEKNLKVSPRYFSKAKFRQLFSFSIHSFFILLSDKIIELTDTIIVGIFMNPVAVTMYSVPQRLIQYLRMLLSKSSEVLFPHFSRLLAKDEHKEIKSTWINGYRLSLAIAFCISVVYFTYGDVFQMLWMGKDFSSMYSVLIIMSIGFILNQPLTNAFLIAVERHKITSKLSFVQAIVNLILSILLVKKWGLVGVALATSIPSFIISSVILPILANKMIGVSNLFFVRKAILPPFLCSILPFFTLLYIKSLGFGLNYFQFGIICGICTILFSIPYVFIFDRSLLKLK